MSYLFLEMGIILMEVGKFPKSKTVISSAVGKILKEIPTDMERYSSPLKLITYPTYDKQSHRKIIIPDRKTWPSYDTGHHRLGHCDHHRVHIVVC